jgi:hypothetical protein
MFFGTAGEVTNGIEDPMSSTADPAQRMALSTAVEALKTAGIVYSGAGNFSGVSSVGSTNRYDRYSRSEGEPGMSSDNESWKYVCKKD